MNNDRSFNWRYSSSRNPSAESTNHNQSTANRSNLSTSFKWGMSPISPKQRSYSSASLSSSDMRMAQGQMRHRSSQRKINQDIAADVQSQGLAFRIVKYHENGSRLNRSTSANNLCTKPGQFPLITLKKPELPYRATRQSVSMTRIAPPENSVFCGSSLSSLWQSNSIVGLHKSDEDISRENRPIIHPPPTENDMAPTRSVLDVLKEISRKRINIDDPDVMETSKKHRLGNVLVDTEAQTIMTHNFKRQRDLNSQNDDIGTSTSKFSNLAVSPARKRSCNHHNEITCSLSSSIGYNPYIKKLPPIQHNQTIPTRLEHKAVQGNQNSKSVDLDNATSKVDRPIIKNAETSTNLSGRYLYESVPPRSNTEPIVLEKARGAVANTKKRITLFNKDYEPASVKEDVVEDNDSSDDLGDVKGIPFVKPKKLTSSISKRNPALERAQKKKLAMMLSALKGEVYNENDEIDAPPQQDINTNKMEAVLEKKADEGSQVLNTKAIFVPTTPVVSSSIPAATLNATISVPTTSSNASPLLGLKMTPSTTTINPSQTTNTHKSEFTLNVSSAPLLQGFASASTTQTVTKETGIATTVSFEASARPMFDFKPVVDQQKDKNIYSETIKSSSGFGASTQHMFVSKPVSDQQNDKNKSNDAVKSLSNPSGSINYGNTTISSTATEAGLTNKFIFSTTKTTTATVPATTSNSSVPTSSANVPIPSTSSTNVSTTSLSNTFNFGSSTGTSGFSSQDLSLGVQTVRPSATPGGFSFGMASTAPKSSLAPTSKPSGGFSFGNTTTAKPKTSTPTTATPIAATPTTATPKTATPTSATPTTATSTISQFSFIAAAAKVDSAAAKVDSAAAKVDSAAPAFGFTNNDKASKINSVTSKAAPALTSSTKDNTTLFGNTSKPSPSFGSTVEANTSNIFGSSSVQPQYNAFDKPTPHIPGQPLFGSSTTFTSKGNKPRTSIFGGSSTNKPADANQDFSFGATATAAPAGGGFAFGSTNNAVAYNNNSTAAPAASGENKPFSFGGAAMAPESNKPSNIFGGATQNPVSSESVFGSQHIAAAVPKSETNGSNNIFGSAASKPATFAFGGTNSSSSAENKSISSTSGGFAFGSGLPQKTNSTTLPKPFSFGGDGFANNNTGSSPNNRSVANNMFASNVMNRPAAVPSYAAPSTSQQGANLFAPTPNNTRAAGTVNGDRPIRRATRRLQK